MTLQGPALRLTVFIGEDDRWHHKPLYTEIATGRTAPGWLGRRSSAASRATEPPHAFTPPGC